jgi:hypothetical protein
MNGIFSIISKPAPFVLSLSKDSGRVFQQPARIRALQRGWIIAVLSLFLLLPAEGAAQEKKNLRLVLVSLSWNSALPVRVAIAKGYFKEQGFTVDRVINDHVLKLAQEELRKEGRLVP